MHRDERFPCGESETFGEVDADEQRADQTGIRGHGDGLDIVEGQVGFGECFAANARDRFGVTARGDLRHDAAVKAMLFHLCGDDTRQHFPTVFNDGGGGLVARRFDSKNIHQVASLS